MEAVSLATFATLFLLGPAPKSAPMWVFFALWTAHYLNRALIFPWRLRTAGKSMPLAIAAAAMLFNLVNAGLNGLYLGVTPYAQSWLSDPRFGLGLAVFLGGAALNLWADGRLIALREDDAAHYAIPRGGAFELVSCPNHLGEILEWSGFALMCWNGPALSFAIWTAANLGPARSATTAGTGAISLVIRRRARLWCRSSCRGGSGRPCEPLPSPP